MLNGPIVRDRVADREPRRDDPLRQLVGDDRGAGDDGERSPLRGAGAERALGARDRLQRVGRRADADVEPPRRHRCGRARSTVLLAALVSHAERRVRARPRAAPRGSPRRRRRTCRRCRLDARQRLVDLGDDVLGVLLERLVELAVDDLGGVVGEVLVAGGGVDLALALVVGGEVCGGLQNAARAGAAARPAGPRDRWSRSLLPGGGEAPLRFVECEAGRARRPCRVMSAPETTRTSRSRGARARRRGARRPMRSPSRARGARRREPSMRRRAGRRRPERPRRARRAGGDGRRGAPSPQG